MRPSPGSGNVSSVDPPPVNLCALLSLIRSLSSGLCHAGHPCAVGAFTRSGRGSPCAEREGEVAGSSPYTVACFFCIARLVFRSQPRVACFLLQMRLPCAAVSSPEPRGTCRQCMSSAFSSFAGDCFFKATSSFTSPPGLSHSSGLLASSLRFLFFLRGVIYMVVCCGIDAAPPPTRRCSY